jgi:Protein of unknown function (DUF2585)
MKPRRTTLACLAAGAGIITLASIVELAIGRRIWGIGGEPGIWSGDINSSHNSQFLFDPYSFSHVTHGILLYGLFSAIAHRLSRSTRVLLVIVVESAWEVFENTNFIIERYRAATISLHYYGDSVMNSMCDILCCALGVCIASVLPTRVSIAGVLMLEVALALWIHDGLLLNIIMLIHPIPAIRSWQSG